MRPIIFVQFLADIFQRHPCCFKGFSEVSKSMPVAENVEPRPADRKALINKWRDYSNAIDQ